MVVVIMMMIMNLLIVKSTYHAQFTSGPATRAGFWLRRT